MNLSDAVWVTCIRDQDIVGFNVCETPPLSLLLATTPIVWGRANDAGKSNTTVYPIFAMKSSYALQRVQKYPLDL